MMLKVSNLTKKFDSLVAVNNADFEFESGKITSLIGPNGSGKTTVVNLLSGIFPFDKGTINISGQKIKKIHSHHIALLGITRTFQDVRLFEQMSTLDNVLVVLSERNLFGSIFDGHKKIHLAKAEEILKKFDLWKKKDDNAHDLSYGQRKLLEIARVYAMLSAPVGDITTIFFDEPFAGLFPEMAKMVSDTILELKEKGLAIVLIEHDMDIIRKLSDKVIVMDSGEVLAIGTPEHVLSKADVVDAYIGD